MPPSQMHVPFGKIIPTLQIQCPSINLNPLRQTFVQFIVSIQVPLVNVTFSHFVSVLMHLSLNVSSSYPTGQIAFQNALVSVPLKVNRAFV